MVKFIKNNQYVARSKQYVIWLNKTTLYVGVFLLSSLMEVFVNDNTRWNYTQIHDGGGQTGYTFIHFRTRNFLAYIRDSKKPLKDIPIF